MMKASHQDPVVLGVLTATHPDDPRRLGAQTINYAELSRVGRRRGVRVVVFKPEDLRCEQGVRGYVYDHRRRRWHQVEIGWPDIVYNRVPRRSIEARPDVQEALQRLQREGVPVFNPGFLNKWTIYQVLSRDPKTAGHVPPTRPLRSVDDVRRGLKEWGAVYLKPVGGSLGRGIIFLLRRADGYVYHAFLHRRYRKGWRSRWRELRRLLVEAVDGRRYIIQAAIRRPHYKGRPFDVRCLLQKPGSHGWRVVGAAARVAAPGRVLTHVPRGGERCEIRRALEAAFGDEVAVERILARLDRVAVDAAKAIDQHHRGLFAELSVDLTLDRQGRPWVLECNAKPARFDEHHIHRRHLRGVVDFARETVRRMGNGLNP